MGVVEAVVAVVHYLALRRSGTRANELRCWLLLLVFGHFVGLNSDPGVGLGAGFGDGLGVGLCGFLLCSIGL